MAIKIETAGEGAIGADAAPSVRPAKRFSDGAPAASGDRKPMGLVAVEAEVGALQSRVAALEDEVRALVSRETRQSHDESQSQFQSHESHGRETDDQPWIAAGVSRSTWFRQRKAEAGPLPDNVIRLQPKGATTKPPALDTPAIATSAAL